MQAWIQEQTQTAGYDQGNDCESVLGLLTEENRAEHGGYHRRQAEYDKAHHRRGKRTFQSR